MCCSCVGDQDCVLSRTRKCVVDLEMCCSCVVDLEMCCSCVVDQDCVLSRTRKCVVVLLRPRIRS